ncbi:MAG: DUF1073 domain-containing protein [Candidatus Peribacteraceae bacterium]|nr:DUF1073 domain-containing protein [Candidatus Peribacteraceae bacterium]
MSILKKPILNRKGKLQELCTLGDITLALQRVSGNEYKRYLRTDKMGQRLLSLKAKAAFNKGEPLSGAAIEKTASMMTDKWMEMDDPTRGQSMNDAVNEQLVQDHRRLKLPQNFDWLIKQAMIFGNGWLEIIPEIGDTEPTEPLMNLQGISHFEKVDSEHMAEYVKPDKRSKGTFFFIEQRPDGQEVLHHESRVLHLPWFQIGSDPLGFGIYDRSFRSMIQKIKMDWAVGQVIYRYGKPFLVLKTTGGGKKDVLQALKLIKNLNPNTGFAGTEKHTFEILNPTAIDPKPFAEYYYINSAAACEMPMFEFMGAQRGQVTGGEVDLGGWYNLLASKQNIKLSPLIYQINNILLDDLWEDEVYWNPMHVDQKRQAEIDKLNAETVKLIYNDGGLCTDVEGRQLLRDYGISIPKDDSDFLGEKEEKEEEPKLPEGFEPYDEEEEDGK